MSLHSGAKSLRLKKVQSAFYQVDLVTRKGDHKVCSIPERQPGNYLTNRFHVAVRLFSNRSQMTSKCGKNKKVAHEVQPSVSLMFLPHFDVLCDLLLNRRMATWNLFVLYNKKIKIHGKNALLFEISPL